MDVINICKRLFLLTPDRVKLTPHMLRHTLLKRITDNHGVHVAQKLSGNVSIKEKFRFVEAYGTSIEGSSSFDQGLLKIKITPTLFLIPKADGGGGSILRFKYE
jgi:hypothetical protein